MISDGNSEGKKPEEPIKNGRAAPPPTSLEALADAKRLPPAFLANLGVRNDGGRVAIDYLDVAGNLLFTRHRPGRNGQRFDQPAGVRLQPYGLWRLEDACRQGTLIFVEGESDCWAL